MYRPEFDRREAKKRFKDGIEVACYLIGIVLIVSFMILLAVKVYLLLVR